MLDRGIAVLKFGSSVLRSEADLPVAAQEIYGEVRRGYRVVAVVSAFAGATDRLLRTARRHFAAPRPAALARWLATGEAVAATSLGMMLDDAGVPNVVLEPHEVGLRTRGAALDAEPDGLDADALRRLVGETSVVILSGFVGRGADGSPSLLGRGGSDLTALFLAHRLDARTCRLLKDVDGLHTHDPRACDTARRYRAASWAEALRAGGALVQTKAVRYAERWGLPFVVSRPGFGAGTEIGAGPSRRAPRGGRQPVLRVGLAGLGTVGLGVYRWLRRWSGQFDIVSVLVDDPAKERPDDVEAALLTDDPWTLLARQPDVVVELIGGTDTAAVLVGEALAEGLDVVTANKALLASNPTDLVRSESPDRRLRCSASVGGAVPVLERLSRLAREHDVVEIVGVLNGTCNYVLDRMSDGCGFDEAVREAQENGFAERDPSRDVSGWDAACKLVVIAAVAFGAVLPLEAIRRRGIEDVTPETARQARTRGTVMRSVARLARGANGWRGRVAPEEVRSDDPLAVVCGEENAVVARTSDGRCLVLRGKGAGRWPTAIAVVADLLDVYRRRTGERTRRVVSIP